MITKTMHRGLMGDDNHALTNPWAKAIKKTFREQGIDEQRIVIRCAFCQWSTRGKFGAVRGAHKAHMELKHS